MRQLGGDIVGLSVDRDKHPGALPLTHGDTNDENVNGPATTATLSSTACTLTVYTETSVTNVKTHFPHCHLHKSGLSTALSTQDSTSSAYNNAELDFSFRLKPLLAALQFGSQLPQEFCLARFAGNDLIVFCFPLQQMENSHVTCTLQA
eukprot:Lankesteria_metandrocarpae@DN3253_c0_g1_i1.p1